MTNRQLAAAKTREQLLLAGKKLICEKGLSHTAIEEITTAAGVSKGTFYTYFKRKEDLVLELSHDMFGEILNSAKAVQGDFTAKLTWYMTEFSGYIEQSSVSLCQEWVKNILDSASEENGEGMIKLQYDLDSICELFRYGMEEGLIKDNLPVESLSRILIELLYGQMLCWDISNGSASLKERTQIFCRQYLPVLLEPYLS